MTRDQILALINEYDPKGIYFPYEKDTVALVEKALVVEQHNKGTTELRSALKAILNYPDIEGYIGSHLVCVAKCALGET